MSVKKRSGTILPSSKGKGRGISCFHNSSHDSQVNMSHARCPLPLYSSFVLILKGWHWEINNLPLGFQMSQQSLSSHADVLVASDVCNMIWARRELTSGLRPLTRLCILSSLVRRDAKLQSLNAARPPGHLSTVTAVLNIHKSENMSLWLTPLLYIIFIFCLSAFLFCLFFALMGEKKHICWAHFAEAQHAQTWELIVTQTKLQSL